MISVIGKSEPSDALFFGGGVGVRCGSGIKLVFRTGIVADVAAGIGEDSSLYSALARGNSLQGRGKRTEVRGRGQKSPGVAETRLWINFAFYSPILIGCSTYPQPSAATSPSDARVVVKTFRLRF
jgi:hypothetical protein